VQLELFVTQGLGDASYLLAADGEALVVDPQRDVDGVLATAADWGVRIGTVVETHVHNDYLSGALELRSAAGAEIAAPAAGGYAFPHRGLGDGDDIRVGSLLVRALATPGHTPEHLSYLVFGEGSDTPVAAFTGGSLIVGNAGRTDLLGIDLAQDLVRDQYRSLRRLAALPPDVHVLPTHGSGSFCASGPASPDRTSTIGRELAGNPALSAPDEATFAREQLDGLPDYPAYYRHMAPINRTGPAVIGRVAAPPALEPDAFAALPEGVWVVDGRAREEFAAGHVPRSINVELDENFASYVGWVVPFDAPVALVVPEPESERAREAAVALARIGFEHVTGYLAGGPAAWSAGGRPTDAYATGDVADLCEGLRGGEVPAGRVVDVRQMREWDAGHVPGSRHAFVGDLGDLDRRVAVAAELSGPDPKSDGAPSWVICASGHRASVAASLLAREGVPVRLVRRGGVARLLRTCPEAGASS
jgi:glyoxylase-like metal-dependent hydrolase (beta-lactamase superfamily II)/rhodanese-related sulfurtransferase